LRLGRTPSDSNSSSNFRRFDDELKECIFFEDASKERNDRKAIYFTDYFWEPRYLFVRRPKPHKYVPSLSTFDLQEVILSYDQ